MTDPGARRLVWITGASSGLGLATAEELAGAGFLVVLSARRREPLQAARAAIIAVGGAAEFVVADVTDSESVAAAARTIESTWGPIDILVNNAGMNVAARAWGDVSVENFDRLIDANLSGVFYCIHAVLPGMRARSDGLVVNVSSFAGWHVTARPGPGYTASKQAVIALTDSLNMSEFSRGIRACALCPGEAATPAMLRRQVPPSAAAQALMLTPRDVARAVRYIVEQPAHVCVNQLVLSPTWNGAYGAAPNGPKPRE